MATFQPACRTGRCGRGPCARAVEILGRENEQPVVGAPHVAGAHLSHIAIAIAVAIAIDLGALVEALPIQLRDIHCRCGIQVTSLTACRLQGMKAVGRTHDKTHGFTIPRAMMT